MDIDEAYIELGLKKDATKDDLNKVFRKLAAKYHPDVCKEDGADLKFKKINEAKQIVEKNIDSPKINYSSFINSNIYEKYRGNSFNINDVNDWVGSFIKDKIINVSFTFNEAANGCSKTISYERLIKCNRCNLDSVNCKNCNNTKSVNVSVVKTVNFKGPIFNKDKIRLVEFGDFIPIKNHLNPSKDRYADILIYAEVEKSNLTINRSTGNIESSVNVPLVDALGGGSVDVETIKHNVSVKVPPKTKNGTKLKLGGYGPNNKDHIITVNVDYPEGDELDSLISFLKKE